MLLNLKKELILLQVCQCSYKTRQGYLYWRLKQQGDQTLTLSQFIQSLDQFFPSSSQRSECIKRIIHFSSHPLLVQWHDQAIMMGEPRYPLLWYEISQPPLLVFWRGALALLKSPLVSIVGTRKMTAYGQLICQKLVQAIIDQGWLCVSGLALGVDACVHQTAMNYCDRSTLAIIPSGWDKIYPKVHQGLLDQLMAKHLVLSEFLPNTPARKHQFIMRNRLLAGIAPVTIVVEAAKHSGSLITANFALQANREILALPGRITDSQSAGCNQLIEAGATPILSINATMDFLQDFFDRQDYFTLVNQTLSKKSLTDL